MKKAPTVNNSTRAFPFPIWLIPGKPSTFSPAQLRQYLDASSGSWASGTTSTTRPGSPGSTLSYEKTTPRGWSFSRWKGRLGFPVFSCLKNFLFPLCTGTCQKGRGSTRGSEGLSAPKRSAKTVSQRSWPASSEGGLFGVLRCHWEFLAAFSAISPVFVAQLFPFFLGQVSSVRRPGRR